jgi:glycolate oxidase FAD binding subunit
LATSLASERVESRDLADALAAAVADAAAAGRPLAIMGGGTKSFLGRRTGGEPLQIAGHRGIVAYDPAELVITARAGTPLSEIEARLEAAGQQLSFEPPRLGPASTIGGVVAAGLSGPRRPFAGAVRDSLLGVRLLDGRGRRLRFGGQVFKNVAGFDAFRLMAGALGVLGVLLEVSLRVSPRPRREAALALDMESEPARAWIAGAMRRPLPLSGAFHDGRRLRLRLAGGEAAVEAASRTLGGEPDQLAVWGMIRDLSRGGLAGAPRLWRLSLPQTARVPCVGDVVCWDWAGSQVWLAGDAPADAIREAAGAIGGHATLFRGAAGGEEVFQPLSPALLAVHRRLKAAFDPAGILNPGRLYGGL